MLSCHSSSRVVQQWYLQLCYLSLSQFQLRLKVLHDAGASREPGGLIHVGPPHWHRQARGCQWMVQRVILWIDETHRISSSYKRYFMHINLCNSPNVYLRKKRGVQTSCVSSADGAGTGQCGRGRGWRLDCREGQGLPFLKDNYYMLSPWSCNICTGS